MIENYPGKPPFQEYILIVSKYIATLRIENVMNVSLCLFLLMQCLCAEIAYGKLLEMKGRVNLGLESENMVL